jgi:hypothetical protein
MKFPLPEDSAHEILLLLLVPADAVDDGFIKNLHTHA